MNDDGNCMEQAMRTLKARSRGRVMSDAKMEDRIMQEFEKVRVRRRRRWTTALLTIVALAVSSVGFAAAGGVEVVKRWFIQVELVDTSGKKPAEIYELQGTEALDADGNRVGDLTITFSNNDAE